MRRASEASHQIREGLGMTYEPGVGYMLLHMGPSLTDIYWEDLNDLWDQLDEDQENAIANALDAESRIIHCTCAAAFNPNAECFC